MFGLPMEIVGPVIGIGGIIMIAASAVVMVRRLAPGGGARERLSEELEARLGELDQVKQRLGELEERVDFAERMLAQQRDAGRLPPPKD